MLLNDIKKITSQYMLVKRTAPRKWQALKPAKNSSHAQAKLKVVATKATRAHAVAVVQAQGCAALEPRGGDDYAVLSTSPAENYLQGLIIAAAYTQTLLAAAMKTGAELTSVRGDFLQNISNLSGTAFAAIRSQERSARDVLLADQLDERCAFDTNDVYSWEEIKKLAPQIGIIQKNKFCTKQKLDLYDLRVHGKSNPFPAAAPANIHVSKEILYYEQNCQLIVEKLGTTQYKILYCDSAKNYLRGTVRAYKILEPLIENPTLAPRARIRIIENLLWQEIREQRERAGYSILSSKIDFPAALDFSKKGRQKKKNRVT